MKKSTKKNIRKLLVQGITLGSAFLIKKVAEDYIDNRTSKSVPKEPDQENDQTWTQAITYAAFSGAFLGTFKLIVNRATDQKLEKLL